MISKFMTVHAKSSIRLGALVSLLFVCVACANLDVVSGADSVPTFEMRMTEIATEIANLQGNIISEQTQVAVTVIAAEDAVSRMVTRNEQLLATVRAGDPPQSSVIISSNPGASIDTLSTPDPNNSPSNFINTQMASAVQESDGCASSVQSVFEPTASRIYFTTQATPLVSGSRIAVDWRYEGQLVTTTEWVADRDEDFLCIWFFLEPTVDVFSSGDWSATLMVDNQRVGESVDFTISGNF